MNRDELIAEIKGQAKWSLEIDHDPTTLEFSGALLQLVEDFESSIKLLQDIKADLALRADTDCRDGSRVVNLGATLWNRLCDLIADDGGIPGVPNELERRLSSIHRLCHQAKVQSTTSRMFEALDEIERISVGLAET